MSYLSCMLQHMYYELKYCRLEVVLIDAPDSAFSGHKIRTVVNENPDWYKELCRQYQSNRNSNKGRYKKHGDTKVKRNHVLSILERLATGLKVRSKYSEYLLQVAENIYSDWQEKIQEPEVPF